MEKNDHATSTVNGLFSNDEVIINKKRKNYVNTVQKVIISKQPKELSSTRANFSIDRLTPKQFAKIKFLNNNKQIHVYIYANVLLTIGFFVSDLVVQTVQMCIETKL